MNPALGAAILFKCERIEYPPEYLIQHLSVCVTLHMQPVQCNIAGVDRERQESDHYDTVCGWNLAHLGR